MLSDRSRPVVSGFSTAALAALLTAGLVAGCTTPPDAAAQPAPTRQDVLATATPPPAAPHSTEPATTQPVAAPDTPAQPRTLPPLQPVLSLLAYAEKVRTLGTPELAAEITRLGEPEAPLAQVQLALALLQTHLPSDTARALGLLQKSIGPASTDMPTLQAFARLLAARATEQRRLEDTVDRQNQQLLAGQKRIDQLSDRLEAMRAIERSLTSRPGAPVIRTPQTTTP